MNPKKCEHYFQQLENMAASSSGLHPTFYLSRVHKSSYRAKDVFIARFNSYRCNLQITVN